MTSSRLAHALIVLAAFSAGFALLFSPVWAAGGALGTNDAIIYYHPAFVARPLGWTSSLWAGYPVQGDPQTMTWYPPAMLLAPLGAWNAFVISAYALAGSFAYAYAHRVTSSPLSGWVAGTAFAAGGFAIAHLDHITMVHGMAWIPAVLWGLEVLRTRISAPALAGIAVAVASCLLAGHPQVFVYAAIVWAAYALVAGASAPSGRARYWTSAAAAGALGVGLAALAWVPTLELASHSTRDALTRSEFFEFSFAPWQLGQLLVPYLFGGAVTAGVPPAGPPDGWPLPYFGPGRLAEVTGTIGLVPLVLAAVAARLAPRRRLVAFWSAVAGVALLLALGDSLPGPVAELLFHTPGLNRFRVPTRHLMELGLAVAVLAALGTDALAKLEASARKRMISGVGLGVAALVAVALAASVAALEGGSLDTSLHWAGVTRAEALPWHNPALALQAVVVALAAGALVAWGRRPAGARAAGLACAVALELGATAALGTWRMSPAPDRSRELPAPLAELRAELRASGQRMGGLTFDAPDTAAPPNRNWIQGIPHALGYGPLPLNRYAELLDLGPAGLYARAMGRVISPEDRSFDLLSVRYLAVPDGSVDSEVMRRESLAFRPVRRGPGNWPEVVAYLDRQPRWRRHAALGGAVLFENRRALPRAWLASELRVLPRDELLRTIHGGRLPDGTPFDPRRTALLEEPAGRPLRCPQPCGDARIEADAETTLRLRVEARGDAMLVVSDVLYPGWRVFVDGEETEIHRVHYALRGVVVPAGRHEVLFSFEPASFRWGLSVTAASGLALLAWTAGLHRSSLRRRQ